MATLEGKHFSITDPKDVNTIIYRINETEKEYQKDSPKYTVERLDSMSEIRGENTKRTYFVDMPSPEYDQLVILSFGKDRVVINNGILEEDKVKISKKPTPFKFETVLENIIKRSCFFSCEPNPRRYNRRIIRIESLTGYVLANSM